MDTRPVAIVDAFAGVPMAGTPVCVVLEAGDLEPGQRAAIAGEVGPATTAFAGESAVAVEADRDPGRGIHVAVAVTTALRDRGRVDDEESLALRLEGEDVAVSLGPAGRVWVDVPAPEVREAAVSEQEAAEALGVDPASVRDVAADFPLVRASMGGAFLVVPVNFLGALSGASPDGDAVADLLDATGTEAVYALTFDTLGADADAHGLLVGRDGRSAHTTGEAAACAAAAIGRHGASDRDHLRFEAGDLLDRPARVSVRAGDDWQVGGRAATALEGTVGVPPADSDDEIVEG